MTVRVVEHSSSLEGLHRTLVPWDQTPFVEKLLTLLARTGVSCRIQTLPGRTPGVGKLLPPQLPSVHLALPLGENFRPFLPCRPDDIGAEVETVYGRGLAVGSSGCS